MAGMMSDDFHHSSFRIHHFLEFSGRPDHPSRRNFEPRRTATVCPTFPGDGYGTLRSKPCSSFRPSTVILRQAGDT